MKPVLILALLSAPAWADTCPPAPDNAVALSALIDDIRDAPNEAAARPISGEMWKLWLMAPDASAQEVLDQGMRQRNNYDLSGSIASFDRLVSYCPHYAEGYNQRAFSYFLTEDFGAALIDLDAALRLSPDHVGAQSGRALTLMNLGRIEEARSQMQAALENNPWLSERALLAKGAPLGPVGEDI